jgi:cAMP-regulated phosphoprotein/endosulfine conserved region
VIFNASHVVGVLLQTKFFDSGDYAMAKAKGGTTLAKQPPPAGGPAAPAPELPIGEAIPTPENVPHRKQANRLSKLVSMS